jgi:hypothetical protein
MADYINSKLKVLKHFCIRPTTEQVKHLRSLPTEVSVDNYIKTLMLNAFESEN